MIRLFAHSDLAELNQMIHKTIDFSYPAVYPNRAVLFFKKYHSRDNILERHQNGKVIVFEIEGNIFATGSLVGNEISGVFVDPERQRSGLGKKIMAELESLAQATGISQLTLSVSLPSRQFYESLNYEIMEDLRIDVGEGQFLNYWIAKKNINQN